MCQEEDLWSKDGIDIVRVELGAVANGQLPIEILLFQDCLFIFELDSNCNVINRDIKNRLKTRLTI